MVYMNAFFVLVAVLLALRGGGIPINLSGQQVFFGHVDLY